MPYRIHQLKKLLNLESESKTRSLINSRFVRGIFKEYRLGIGGDSAPEHLPWMLRSVSRLMEVSDYVPEDKLGFVCEWCADSPDKTKWTADYHAARFAWKLDRWANDINGGWVRDGDRFKEIVRVASVLVLLHELEISYDYRLSRMGINPLLLRPRYGIVPTI